MSTSKINTSSLPPGPLASSSKPLASTTQTLLTAALLSSNSIPRIEAALSQDLAACGWTANLRAYVTHLLRSGECSTYAECMAKVMVAVRAANADGVKRNGAVAGVEGGDLAIPVQVLKDGVKTVRKEVEKVCDLRVDDVDD